MVAPSLHAPASRTSAGESATKRSLAGLSIPMVATFVGYVVLFASPAHDLFQSWSTEPDAGHGLLLFPVSLWLAWREGIDPKAKPNRRLGTALLIIAVLTRAVGSLAAEIFSQRFSMWLAAIALVIFYFGLAQVRRWWLPAILLLLSIPLPAIIMNVLANPLQFRASRVAVSLIKWRKIPVLATGNVINIPGHQLFVAEACSGLRSLTALIALGVMIGGMYLRTVPSRLLLLGLTIPVAIMVNAFRIFLTAFLMYFVDPSLGVGAAHMREGFMMFAVAFVILALVAAVVRQAEALIHNRGLQHD